MIIKSTVLGTSLSLFLLFLSQEAQSQDIIHRNNGKKIDSKIIEINSNEIKYKEYDNQDGPIYTLEKKFIDKIVYQNGKIEKYDKNFYDNEDKEWYLDNRKNAIKLNFLAPFMGYTEIGYEHNIKVGQAYELSLGIIGLGKSRYLDYYNNIKYEQRGAFISAGYKFSNMPSFFIFGKPRQKHLFHGTYIKPIVYVGSYSQNHFAYTNTGTSLERKNTTFGSLNIEFGKQWEFSNRILFDLYFGFGYGFDNKKMDFEDNGMFMPADYSFNYANTRAGSSPGFSTTFGAKIGYLFDWKKK